MTGPISERGHLASVGPRESFSISTILSIISITTSIITIIVISRIINTNNTNNTNLMIMITIIMMTIVIVIIIREFTKGGLVKGGFAIRHVFNFHIQNGTQGIAIAQGKRINCSTPLY